jgi:hypothetical protein
MKLYNAIEKLEAETLFKYIAVFISSIFLIGRINIGLNVILAIFIAVAIILYLEDKRVTKSETLATQHELKLNTIKPIPKNFEPYYDIVDFFFSIQDFYPFNPPVYEEVIDNVDNFLKLYEYVKKTGVETPEKYYDIAENKKQNAVNALHSMIFKLEVDKIVTNKLDRSCKQLDEILRRYLDEMYNIYKKDIYKKGYDSTRSLINTGPSPVNHYTNIIGDVTYDIY